MRFSRLLYPIQEKAPPLKHAGISTEGYTNDETALVPVLVFDPAAHLSFIGFHFDQ